MTHLVIVPSTNKNKKYDAIFSDGITYQKISFGAANMNDYGFSTLLGCARTITGDKKARERYIKRHEKHENWNTVNAGSLSRYILWGDSNDINKNIKSFKKKFNFI